MAYGTLAVDTLNSSTGVLATQNGITGICKAWVQLNNTVTNGTIGGSFNVSSVTYNASGDYTINFTTAMPNANYCAVGSNSYSGSNSYNYLNMFCSASSNQAPTTTSFRVASGSNLNSIYMCIAVFSS